MRLTGSRRTKGPGIRKDYFASHKNLHRCLMLCAIRPPYGTGIPRVHLAHVGSGRTHKYHPHEVVHICYSIPCAPSVVPNPCAPLRHPPPDVLPFLSSTAPPTCTSPSPPSSPPIILSLHPGSAPHPSPPPSPPPPPPPTPPSVRASPPAQARSRPDARTLLNSMSNTNTTSPLPSSPRPHHLALPLSAFPVAGAHSPSNNAASPANPSRPPLSPTTTAPFSSPVPVTRGLHAQLSARPANHNLTMLASGSPGPRWRPAWAT